MMQQTKPFFIIKKYRSILIATIIVEAINYIVSLTDSIVAGSAVNKQAFAAIGLVAPFLSVSVFLATIVSTGTAVNFSYHVGKFDKRRANEFFSQGMYTAFLLGAVYALLMLLLGGTVIQSLSSSEEIVHYLKDYYYIILLVFFLNPITFTLDLMLISDGSEKLSIVANIIQIAGNIGLSMLLVQHYGVKGVAIATVVSKALFLLIACLHFFKKNHTLRLLRYWKTSDAVILFKTGIVKSSTYGLEALLFWISNQYAATVFGSDTLIVIVAVEKLLGLLTLFMGLAMACQPLIGTMLGENNTKGMRFLMKTVLRDMIVAGLIVSAIILAGAPFIADVFGISGGVQHEQAVAALRIVGSTLVFQAVIALFFTYYVFIDHQVSASVLCLANNLLSPVAITISLSTLMHSPTGLWIGFALSPVFTVAVGSFIGRRKYGSEMFPFLIPTDEDRQIYIYDFVIDDQSAVKMSAVVEQALRDASVPPRTSVLAGVITEDMLIMIAEKNAGAKNPLRAECTIISEPDGVRLILRDSGMIFDITDTDGNVDSFRQYIVSNLMLNQERKLYMTTTGYNRNELYFKNEDDA